MSRSNWQEEAGLVGKLASAMLSQLERKRPHKRHWRGEDVSVKYLMQQLRTRVDEFEENPSWRRAADVANFAAMIVDREHL